MRMLRIALALAIVGGLVAASVGVGLDSSDEALACGEGKLPPQKEYGGVYGVVREIDLDRFARIHRDEIAFARLDVLAVRPGTSQRGWTALHPGDVFALIDPPVPPLDVYMRAEDAWSLETGDCVLVYGPWGVVNCAGTCEPVAWFVDGIAVGLWAESVVAQRR
jgi:hypothetical protein